MALTACRECGQEVSDEALTCPHCGCAHPAIMKKSNAGGFIFLILILALLASIIKTLIDRL